MTFSFRIRAPISNASQSLALADGTCRYPDGAAGGAGFGSASLGPGSPGGVTTSNEPSVCGPGSGSGFRASNSSTSSAATPMPLGANSHTKLTDDELNAKMEARWRWCRRRRRLRRHFCCCCCCCCHRRRWVIPMLEGQVEGCTLLLPSKRFPVLLAAQAYRTFLRRILNVYTE